MLSKAYDFLLARKSKAGEFLRRELRDEEKGKAEKE